MLYDYFYQHSYLEVLFTDWHIFESQKSVSQDFSTYIALQSHSVVDLDFTDSYLHASWMIEFLIARNVILHNFVLADPANLNMLLVAFGATGSLIAHKEDLAKFH